MTSYIDAYKDQCGVEPICQVLEVAPSTYYAAISRPPSARRLRDEELKAAIMRMHEDNFGVYGIEKVWRQLNREGVGVGRNRVARLMRELNLEGVVRGQRKRTTVPADLDERPADLVDRNFRAPAPNRLWVADLSYVSTWSGFVYVAFIIDAFSRSQSSAPQDARLEDSGRGARRVSILLSTRRCCDDWLRCIEPPIPYRTAIVSLQKCTISFR
jgi:putative transposase